MDIRLQMILLQAFVCVRGSILWDRIYGVTTRRPDTTTEIFTNCAAQRGSCVAHERRFAMKHSVPNGRGGCYSVMVKYCDSACRERTCDCTKKWGQCQTSGGISYRREIEDLPALNRGTCQLLTTTTGCETRVPIDCKKKWGPCIGVGLTSYKRETTASPAKFGGKPCTNFKEITGCNIQESPANSNKIDTKGKAAASLFIENFMPKSRGDSPSTSQSIVPAPGTGGIGERSGIGLGNPFAPSKDVIEPSTSSNSSNSLYTVQKVDKCVVAKFKGTNFDIGLSCDSETNIDDEVKRATKAKYSKDPRARGRPRTKRSDFDGSFPVPDQRDVLFLLDSSYSVGPRQFQVEKAISKAIVEVLCGRIALGVDKTRVALATFNARTQLKFGFTKTSSVSQVTKYIDNVWYDYRYQWRSCIKDALDSVIKFYSKTNNVRDPWIAEGDVIIMTDGCANCDMSPGNRDLQTAAYRLKLSNINVYAIGVGISHRCREILKVLARGGRCFHFFFLDNWEIDAADFLYTLKNPREDRCLDKWEFPSIQCIPAN